MAIKSRVGGSKPEFKAQLVTDGQHIVKITQIIDIGLVTPKNSLYKPTNKYVITFEVLDEVVLEGKDAGKHLIITKSYTQSLDKKANLVKDLVFRLFPDDAIKTGKFKGSFYNFDVSKLIGQHLMIDVVHNEATDGSEKKFSNITSFTRLPKNIKPPKGNLQEFTFYLDNYDEEDVRMLQEHGPGYLTKGSNPKLPQFAVKMYRKEDNNDNEDSVV